jgi:Rod binding domain-containing protein
MASTIDAAPIPGTATLSGSVLPKPKDAKQAATQFEGLLIAQMLRTAREGSISDEHDSTADTMFDIAGQQFGQMLAERGGFGLAQFIAKGLADPT